MTDLLQRIEAAGPGEQRAGDRLYVGSGIYWTLTKETARFVNRQRAASRAIASASLKAVGPQQ